MCVSLLIAVKVITKEMERSHRNKENRPACKNKSINTYFRVSKRLFESNKSDNASPTYSLPQPSSPAEMQDDSPYLYEIRKKENASKIYIQGTSTSLNSAMDETPLKRTGGVGKQRISLCGNITTLSYDVIMESPSPNTSLRMKAIEEVINTKEEATLTGDFSQKCTLPLISGKHPELSTLSPETVASLLMTIHNYDFTIIDCRYPYEFSAGHIKSAINLYLKEDVEENFFNLAVIGKQEKTKRLLIFYCEFSSERAPSMIRFIRNRDRRLNVPTYPFVYYPELYLIEGGYKSFFANFKELCEPQDYKPMLARENTDEYVRYKSICKTSDLKLQKDSENK